MFFDVEEEKAINPSIDMEKDIYYPITFGADSGITEVEIVICTSGQELLMIGKLLVIII